VAPVAPTLSLKLPAKASEKWWQRKAIDHCFWGAIFMQFGEGDFDHFKYTDTEDFHSSNLKENDGLVQMFFLW